MRDRPLLSLPTLLAVAWLATMSAAAPAAAQVGGWIADQSSACMLWNAHPVPGEEVTWSGSCEGGKAAGRGTVVWLREGQEISRYDGEYEAGRRHGEGEWQERGGDRYSGQWRGDLADGIGTLTTARGDRYSGAFKQHRFHGHGVWQESDGDRYEGQFVAGAFEGLGALSFAEGGGYVGTFRGGLFEGRGVLVLVTGQSFIGQFSANRPNGRGVCGLATQPAKPCRFKDGTFAAWLEQ